MEIELKVAYSSRVPALTKQDNTSVTCFIQANSLSGVLLDWLKVNPRAQNMKTKVVADIKETLTKRPHMMHRLNKGMLILAKDAIQSSTEGGATVTLVLDDPDLHGIGDGGHTFRATLEVLEETGLPDECFIEAKIYTGLSDAETVAIVSAQNRTNQVDAKSFEDLQQSFEVVKELLKDEPFAGRVEYRMNQVTAEDGPKIDVAEIVSLLMMFSQRIYPIADDFLSRKNTAKEYPVHYNKAAAKLSAFLDMDKAERETMLKELAPIAHDIFVLWDKIESEVPFASAKSVKRFKPDMYTKSGNPKKPGVTRYFETEVAYRLPKGYVYPILQGFRAFVEVGADGTHRWKEDPLEVWAALKEQVSTHIADDKTTAHRFGSSPMHYATFLTMFQLHELRKLRDDI